MSDRARLSDIFEHAFRSSAKAIGAAQRGEYENTPLYDMLASSAGLDYLRQRLPQGIGGYSAIERGEMSRLRASNPELARNTVQVGLVPSQGLKGEVPTPGPAAAAAQTAGVIGADIATDGLRNIWWFLNAPQAISVLATQQAMSQAGKKVMPAGIGKQIPLIKNRSMRMAAAIPAWVGMSMGIGNFARQPGYKAVVPSDEDPRKTDSPVAELTSRYFLGRAGRLLPYDEFVKERPDVSKEEYQAYKRYLFSNPWPLKATAEGIHGPEINFMGKTMPVTTTILPAVAATLGAGVGIRKAGKFLRKDLGRLGKARLDLAEARSQMRTGQDYDTNQRRALELGEEIAGLERTTEREALKRVLGYSTGGLAGTAAIGNVLESMRRANQLSERED